MPRKAFTKLLIDMLHERCGTIRSASHMIPPSPTHTRSTDSMVEVQHTPTSVNLLDHAVVSNTAATVAATNGPGSGNLHDPWLREEDVPQVCCIRTIDVRSYLPGTQDVLKSLRRLGIEDRQVYKIGMFCSCQSCRTHLHTANRTARREPRDGCQPVEAS